jgi:putative acetyltransferase
MGPSLPVRVAIEDPKSAGIMALLAERDAYFNALYSNEDRNARSVDLGREDLVFFTARQGELLLGCGALVLHPGHGELKRFYVRVEARGRGLGRLLVRAVEQEARRRGCRRLMLETGILQPEAQALYRSEGFHDRGAFPPYVNDPLSVFMEKALSTRSPTARR